MNVSWPTAVVVVVIIAAGTALAITNTPVPGWLAGLLTAGAGLIAAQFPKMFGKGDS